MKLDQENLKKLAIVLMGALLTIFIYQTFWNSQASPFKNLTVQAKETRELADGVWGAIGFYKDPHDNVVTIILIGFVLFSIGYRIFMRKSKAPQVKNRKK